LVELGAMAAPVDNFIKTVLDGNSTAREIHVAVNRFMQETQVASTQANEEALRTLAQHLNLDDFERARIVSLVCGALVERGCEPGPIADPLIARLQSLLEPSVALAAECEAHVPKPKENSPKGTVHSPEATEIPPHPNPMASQARHDNVAPRETTASRSVVPKEREELRELPTGDDSPSPRGEGRGEGELGPGEHGDGESPEDAFETVRKWVATTMVKENAAWEALQQFWPVTIAVFSADADVRAKAKPLRDLAAKISTRHQAGHWLRFMLSVLDNEPVLVIEPETRSGIEGRISGVVDNFQLNVLIMDAFPRGFFAKRRVSQSAVDIARGGGPQRGEEVVIGAWNLYTWQALSADGKLPEAKGFKNQEHWIWNEGVPDDIPVFDGRRVVLLGPPSYERSWPAQRLFDKLPGKLAVEKVLKRGEVEEWIGKMAKVKTTDGHG
jgi:hypothetical protein